MGDKASTAESIDFSASTTSNSNNTHQESFSSPLNNFLDGSEFLNSSSGHLNNKRPGIDDGIDQEWRPFGDSKGPSFPSRTISQNTTDTASTFPSTFDFGESDHNKSTTSTFSQMSDTKPAHPSTKAVNPPFTVPETSGLSPGECKWTFSLSSFSRTFIVVPCPDTRCSLHTHSSSFYSQWQPMKQ